jgi:hypothetical protein
MNPHITNLESRLNDFDPRIRANALVELNVLAQQGAVELEPARDVANMHAHTFFSFNAYGYSPTALAWLAKRRGYKLMGTVDFDVLDAVDEFLNACDLVGVRGSTAMEIRLFIPEFATREINSPGEPGVYYHMGIGFTSSRAPKAVAPLLADLRERAARRNQLVIARLNAHLDPVTIEYERDVLPLTPGSYATERHIIVAFIRQAERAIPDLAQFWARKLDMPRDKISVLMADSARFQNTIRSSLVKQGGVAYVQPTPEAFPTVDEFHRLVTGCGAIICATWLDGLSDGEQAEEELLNLLVGKGAAALNIIPDRNWNIKDPAARQTKRAHLQAIVRAAARRDLPVNTGTEMNKLGLPFVDDLAGEVLSAYRGAFRTGAAVMVGHTVLARYAGYGYLSEAARADFPAAADRNRFFAAVGALPALDLRTATDLAARGPAAALEWFRRAVQA